MLVTKVNCNSSMKNIAPQAGSLLYCTAGGVLGCDKNLQYVIKGLLMLGAIAFNMFFKRQEQNLLLRQGENYSIIKAE